MPILTKEIEVKVNARTAEHYESLGYEIPMKKATESTRKKYKKDYVYDIGETFMVKVKDLPYKSNIKINYLCDYCMKNVISIPYASLEERTKGINKLACKSCYPQKVKEVCSLRYGVDSFSKTQDFHEKYTNTMFDRYGVKHNSQLSDYREKFHNTCIDRYGESYWKQFAEKSRNSFREKTGYDSPMQVPEIKEKSKQTCLKRYGYEYSLQVPEVRERIKQSCVEHYGVDHPNKSSEVRSKTAQTYYKNNTIATSKQQLYIYNIYKMLNETICLNYPVSHFNVDICFPEEKLTVEIDFGGHNLSVKLGDCTQEEFDKREIVRNNVIKKEGYKQMHITSRKDFIPSDQTLFQMLSETRNYFINYPNHSWIEYDIDNSIVRNAEYKDGILYNYGELRKVKDSDLSKFKESIA
jgi:very-short-patch-repair endonuclease